MVINLTFIVCLTTVSYSGSEPQVSALRTIVLYDIDIYLFLMSIWTMLLNRYRGHCPTTKYDYGETYGTATNKYFQDYRSEVLNASHDPYARGGEFPTYYTHKPESVISARGRTRDRWLAAPKYSLSNVDFDRQEELKSFDRVSYYMLSSTSI